MSFVKFLNEMPYINASKKAFSQLSFKAQDAIISWETSGWVGGPLEKHVIANDVVAKEIENAFAPIRKILGSSIKLFRGMQKTGEYDASNRLLESWTDNLKVAEHFAGLRSGDFSRSYLKDEITDTEIKKALRNYEIRGFAQLAGYKYVRNKDMPKYYNIFKGNEFLTDGDDLEQDLQNIQALNRERNQNLLSNAIILKETIPTKRIIWVTNNLNSKEFIVKRK